MSPISHFSWHLVMAQTQRCMFYSELFSKLQSYRSNHLVKISPGRLKGTSTQDVQYWSHEFPTKPVLFPFISVGPGMPSARNTGLIFDPSTSFTTQIQPVINIYWFNFLNISQVCLHRSMPPASVLVQHLSGSFLTTTTYYYITRIPSNPVPHSCHFVFL